MTGRLRQRGWAALILALVSVAGCGLLVAPSPHSTITTGPGGLRTFTVFREINGAPILCPTFGLVHPLMGTPRGDPNGDPEPVWLVAPDGRHLSVLWPEGFSVRFEPLAVLLNESGVTVAREGDQVTLGQVQADGAAGTFDDPYIASGILFDGCYPFAP